MGWVIQCIDDFSGNIINAINVMVVRNTSLFFLCKCTKALDIPFDRPELCSELPTNFVHSDQTSHAIRFSTLNRLWRSPIIFGRMLRGWGRDFHETGRRGKGLFRGVVGLSRFFNVPQILGDGSWWLRLHWGLPFESVLGERQLSERLGRRFVKNIAGTKCSGLVLSNEMV